MNDGPVTVLEDAVHLLRDAGLQTLALHWTGGVPLVLVLLVYRGVLADPRLSGARLSSTALLCALLLVWMNCWRAAFAGALRRRLSGSPSARPPLARLVAVQAFLGATKLIAIPLAALILFPLPRVVSFYRSAATFSGLGDPAAIGKARRDSTADWPLLMLLLLLFLAVFLNAATAIGVAPYLVRMLTGYESVFTRSGSLFISNPLFWALAFGLAWLAFDPLVQAAYTIRSYRARSQTTGEDIRATLRRIRLAAAGLVLAVPMLGQTAVQPSELRQSIQRTMQAHEYDWRLPPQARPPSNPSWLVRFTDAFLGRIGKMWDAIDRALKRFWDWLTDQLRDRLPEPGASRSPGAGLQGGMWLTILVVLLALGVLVWRMPWSKLGRVRVSAAVAPATPIRLDAPDLVASDLPEDRWLELAEEALRNGSAQLALRAFYLANLAWLGRLDFIALHPGKTNREYETELRRRTRAVPHARALFAANVRDFECAWYGLHAVLPETLEAYRARSAELKATLATVREEAA